MEKATIHQISIAENWLTNDELKICILKTVAPDKEHYSNDETRPQNIKLLYQLLDKKGKSASRLSEVSSDDPCLILASELAFSSTDYDAIKKVLSGVISKVIFIGGFGIATGANLKRLLLNEDVKSTWTETIPDDANYNCGWIWIKNDSSLSCYIFLKTFIDQTQEPPLKVSEGKMLVRLQTNDLILFPLICSDLICARVNNPKDQIFKSLTDNPPLTTQKILVTLSSYEDKPSNSFWKTHIGKLVNNDHNIRLLVSNCGKPEPDEDEDKDKWRCLSGAFQRIGRMKEPKIPLPHIRFAKDNEFEGLILRNSEYGLAAGKLIWSHDPGTGKYVLSIIFRDSWHDETLSTSDGNMNYEEVLRTIERFKTHTLTAGNLVNKPIGKSFDHEVSSLKDELSKRSAGLREIYAYQLLRKCLFGIQENDSINFDQLDRDHLKSFCQAIMSLLLIKKALELDFPDEEIKYGQVLAEMLEQEILVWKSPFQQGSEMFNQLEKLASDSGSAKVLTVVGEGNGFGDTPSSQKVQSKRGTDYTVSLERTERNPITETRDRVIYWQKMGQIESIYSNEGEIDDLRKQIRSVFEKIIAK